MSYFPIDRTLLTSSLWANGSPEAIKVWVYLLMEADHRTGCVEDALPAIAVRCALSLEATRKAVEWLCSPDPDSRTKTSDGRRIEPLESGGYRIINYMARQKKDYSTQRVRAFRERKRSETPRNARKRAALQGTTKTETEKETNTEPSKTLDPSSVSLSTTSRTSSDAVAPVTVQAEIVSWSRDACDCWISRFGGTAPGGQIGKLLLPLVTRHGWPMVRKAWISYLAQSEAQYASPARFSATFGKWAGLAPDPAAKDDTTAHNERVLQDYVRDRGLEQAVKSMPKLKG